jgi:hypothetical protein
MDICAELTLRIVALAQADRQSRRSTREWFFVPEFRHATWPEAQAILAEAPKPLVVAPLIEPGYVAIWPLHRIDEQHRSGAARNMANLEAYYGQKLAACGLSSTARLQLHTEDHDLELSTGDFQRWYREYAIAVGVTVDKTDQVGIGRLLVRPPGGGAPPLGESRHWAPAT